MPEVYRSYKNDSKTIDDIIETINELDYSINNSYTNIVTSDTSITPGNTYIANSAAQVVFTLPASFEFGDWFTIVGYGAGGWKIAQNAGQTIHFGRKDTTAGAGGYLSSNKNNDSITLIAVVANTDFSVKDCFGNITVV